MKYTQEQVQQKSKEKVEAISILARQLEITMSAEQMMTPDGLIKQIVYYTDNEKYDIVDQPTMPPMPNPPNPDEHAKPNLPEAAAAAQGVENPAGANMELPTEVPKETYKEA